MKNFFLVFMLLILIFFKGFEKRRHILIWVEGFLSLGRVQIRIVLLLIYFLAPEAYNGGVATVRIYVLVFVVTLLGTD